MGFEALTQLIINMSTNSFTLRNRQEVESFEARLDEYVLAVTGLVVPNIRLVNAYDKLQERDDGGRVFTALLDVQINYRALFCDHARLIYLQHECNKLDGESVLSSTRAFFAKMDLQRLSTCYVLRYRALFAKVMGLTILVASPAEYDKFCKAKSRKSSFVKIVSGLPQIKLGFAERISDLLTDFDNTFRTPEAHGTGSLRKWTFLMEPHWNNPQLKLRRFWNTLNQVLIDIGKMFADAEGQ